MGDTSCVLLARQAIYDQSTSVCAYELLFRELDAHVSGIDPENTEQGDIATSSVVTNLFSNLNINLVLNQQPAFINFTRQNLLQEIPTLLPQHQVVIEVLENILIDNELIESLIKFKQAGYRIALDDFVFNNKLDELVALADIIKIDVLHLSEQEIRARLLPLAGFQGQLLAEKIETHEQFRCCQLLGFDLYQGFFLNKPEPIRGAPISENKTILLRLFNELHNPDITIHQLEKIILQLPQLSYRILRLANSIIYYRGRNIENILEAIKLLGFNSIKNWVSLFLVCNCNDIATDLLDRTLIRAKMCESIAAEIYKGQLRVSRNAYTVGLFSTLDAILDEPMPVLLGKISLGEELSVALLEQNGLLGEVLELVKNYERGGLSRVEHLGIDEKMLFQIYVEAIDFSKEILSILREG